MKTILLNWAGFAIGDAALCAVCGFLYGLVFGGIGAKVHHDFPTILTIAGSTALVGFGIGIVGSVFLFLVDKNPHQVRDPLQE